MPSNHDQLFHFTFRHAIHTATWIKSVLPKRVRNAIDWSTFAAAQERIPGVRLRSHFADLVFVAKRVDSDELVWFIIEHKSGQLRYALAQTLRYVVHLRHVLQRSRKGPLPSVVPIIAYHGQAPLTHHQHSETTTPFDRFAPRLPAILVDLGQQPSTRAQAKVSPLVRLTIRALFAVTHCDAAQLLEAIDSWGELVQAVERSEGPPLPEVSLDAIGWYLVDNSDLTEDQVHMALSKNLNHPEGLKMTTGQRIRLESRDLGRSEGRSEGRREGRSEGQLHVLLRQLTKRFGPLPKEIAERVQSAGQPQLDTWIDRVLDAKSLADVFA